MKAPQFISRFSWLVITLGLLFLAKPVAGELVAKMPQVMNPFFLTMANGRIYIVENSSTAHLYTIDSNEVAFDSVIGGTGSRDQHAIE